MHSKILKCFSYTAKSIENDHPVNSLDLPQYVFIPHEHSDQRLARIEKHTMTHHIREMKAEQMQLYRRLLEFSKQYHHQPISKRLDELTETVIHSAHNKRYASLHTTRKYLKKAKLTEQYYKLNKFLKKHAKLPKKINE